MGHSREEKARSHERIVEIAAARLRESGTAGPGVAELMKEAGLTHGGFYKHFGSRDDLVAEAVERALRENEGFVTTLTAGAAGAADRRAALDLFVDWYTSAEHRDSPGAGCAVVAFGADAPRADQRVRAAYTGQVERYLTHLEALLGDRERAAAALSTLVGAVLVARGIGPGELSDEILAAARETVRTMAG
jgi:TetR/AcrR family transcriptional repressor of nem operon